MTFKAFESYVTEAKRALLEPLPGLDAQIAMAPEGRITDDYNPEPATARRGAVLILVYPGAQGVTIPLIKRPEDRSVHSGQIAFPGGAFESPESFPLETALRETEEEIGIPRDAVEVLGLLSPLYIPPSNFSEKQNRTTFGSPVRWRRSYSFRWTTSSHQRRLPGSSAAEARFLPPATMSATPLSGGRRR